MRSHDLNSSDSTQELRLPEPDPANITVLTKNLPNNPILPWNHFDSPWLEQEAETLEPEAPEASEELAENLSEAEGVAAEDAGSEAIASSESAPQSAPDSETSAAIADPEPTAREGDRADS